ncbi:baseplate J/gp47 family protein [Bacillus massiliigorillae]|uniref:baseplate J/gp47 family protein n=1 Tax=Bacillus massiliigorillae TaxID=1243664 RepID=UPI0003A7FA80|nr:baseplate J/gp47 family protein [Bacillus massiliigorillae]
MAYEDKTPDLLHAAMLDNISHDVDKREGSVAYDLTAPAAIEVGNAYTELDTVLGLGFPDTSEGIYLEYICTPFGVPRKPAIKATGEITLSGPAGTLIPIGTRLQTTVGESVFFVTKEEVTLTETPSIVTAEAEIAGAAGKVAAGEINALAPGDLYGIVTVINEQAFEGGVDEESDESLLKRLKNRAQNPATSGNANHYKQWALEVSGIGDAKVFPTWNGGNTVKVVLLDDNKRCPDQTIIDAAANHIEEERPVGPTITTIGAPEVNINVSATLTLATGKTLDEAKQEFIELLTDYLKSLAFKDPIVRYAKIASLLIDVPSLIDYSNLTINEGTTNITITSEQVAVVGTVTFT